MLICNKEHRDIVYDDNESDNKGIYLGCPLCEAEAKICNLEDWIKELKKKKE